MPGLTNVNSRESTFIVQHDTASDFLSVAYPTLRRHEASSNIVLAHALKRVGTEAALTGYQFICDADVEATLSSTNVAAHTPHKILSSFWLTLWSSAGASSVPRLEIVLSCVDWTLGEYPIFLWTPRHPTWVTSTWLCPKIAQLTQHLRSCVPPERVFSVFGMTPLVKAFAHRWTEITGFAVERDPFYAALFSFCNAKTFRDSDAVLPEGHRLRRATPADLESVAQLCKEFADDSVYFPLTIEKAAVEANELISKGQIWVYDVQGEISTICAVTRNTHRVSAVTKVYTTPKWRRKGCAEYLVRYVTARLLFDCGKDCVVLYVGHDNGAQHVYDRVGFAGLCGKEKPEGVEDSLELGFVGSIRGHW